MIRVCRTVTVAAFVNVDLPATCLDWAGVAVPESYEGASLKPLVDGAAPNEWRTDLFCEHVVLTPHITWEGVRGHRHKYARYFDQQPAFEILHDLKQDPDEFTNLADSPEHAAMLTKLRQRCDKLVMKYDGPLVPVEERSR